MKTNDVCSIYEQLLSAACGEITFDAALGRLVAKFGGVGGVVFELNRKTGEIRNWVGPGLEAGEKDYINHLNAINPRMRYSLRHAAGHVNYEGRFIDDRGIDRHEFYDAIRNITDVRYFLGSRVFDDGDFSLFHSIEFSKNHGHPDGEEIALFGRLAPAIGNAWKMASRMRDGASTDDPGTLTPNHLPWSIFALAADGSVVSMNEQAKEMLATGQFVELNDGKLATCDRKSDAPFTACLKKAYCGDAAETLIHSSPGSAPLIAQVLPANPGNVASNMKVSVLVYIWNPMLRPRQFGKVLMRLYKFTDAEINLLNALVSGADLNMAAETLNVSRNTARNQLQSVFTKTDTHRQSDLLIQIMGVLEH